MNPFTGRLLGYICFSLFLAFVAGPYTAERVVSKNDPAVYLSAVALSNSAQRAACSERLISVSEEDLMLFPQIRKAISFLSHYPIETNQMSLYGGNLEAFIKRTLGRSQKTFCFEYGGKTFSLVWLIIRDMGTLYLVGLSEPPPVPSLAKSKLSEYPGMAFYFRNLEEMAQSLKDSEPKKEAVPPSSRSGESMKIIDDAMRRFKQIQRQVERQHMVPSAVNRGVSYKKERTALGWDEWVSLNRALGTREENAVFRIGDYLIIGASETIPENVTIDIGWFRVGRYLFAVVFLCFGLFSMMGVYRKRPGINLNPG